MAKTKSKKAKKKSQKTKVKVPEVMDQGAPVPVMDGTSHTEISVMQNVKYSEEIIQEARRVFNLERLEGEKRKGIGQFLIEGEKQILTLWHSIVALDTHNTMFVVLFLIAIGEILNQLKSELKPHEFSKWRREVFRHKHERYLVQAQQLANMGQFAKVYASMGKKRLLALDQGVDFSNAGWVESQKTNIDEGTLCEANRYIKKIGRVLGIKFSDCSSTNAQSK